MDHDQTSMYVRRAVGGDAEGIEWIVNHFHPLVEAQTRLRLRGRGSPQDVEDLASEVWIVALRNFGRLQPRDGRLAPVLVKFLGTTVLQTCNNFLRAQIRRARGVGGGTDESVRGGIEDLPAQTLGIVTKVARRDVSSAVHDCIERLGPEKRDVLVLRLMEHRTNQEIGVLLGIPANTVAVRYKRALEELRESMPAAIYEEICTVAG